MNRIEQMLKKLLIAPCTLYKKIEAKSNRRKLNNHKFTIISNNCWGGFIYQKYGLKYHSLMLE